MTKPQRQGRLLDTHPCTVAFAFVALLIILAVCLIIQITQPTDIAPRIFAAILFAIAVCLLPLGPYIDDLEASKPTPSAPEPASPTPHPSGLTPDEVDAILASMQEVTADTRNHLNMVLRARMTEKSNGL